MDRDEMLAELTTKAAASTYTCNGKERRFEPFVREEAKQGALTAVAPE